MLEDFMHKIPEDFNFHVIKGKTIDQVAFGSNVITLYFDGGYIQIEGNFEYTDSERTVTFEEIYPISHDFGLLQLLDTAIIDIMTTTRETLILTFNNGHRLILQGVDQYESFSVCVDGKTIIV